MIKAENCTGNIGDSPLIRAVVSKEAVDASKDRVSPLSLKFWGVIIVFQHKDYSHSQGLDCK